MKRSPHFIPGNKSSQLPSNVVWFDTETKPTTGTDGRQYHHLWFGWACYQRRISGTEWKPPIWFRFESIPEFWDWVESRTRAKTRLLMMCHNGGFDLPVLDAFNTLLARGYHLRSAVVDAPPIILKWIKGSRTIQFIDTVNIWKMPLKKLGESIGVPKLTMPEQSAPDDEWDNYGKQDVEVIRRATLEYWAFLRDNDLGCFAPTIASQAFSTFRHRFMEHQILIDDSDRAADISRDSYVGGRCECFRLGTYDGDIYYLDVNSMYPSVMINGQFPRKLRTVTKYCDIDDLKEWQKDNALIADCIVETDEPAYPLKHEHKLIFPVGKFRVSLTGAELKYALANDHVRRVIATCVYEQAPVFNAYIKYMYALRMDARQRGDEVGESLAKLFLNTLYGKFGQRGRRYEIIDTTYDTSILTWQHWDVPTQTLTNMRQFGGIIQEFVGESESRHSFPAIASFTTSYARMVLYRAIHKAGRENVLYCDTDSMVVNSAGLSRMQDELDANKLGAWKVEDKFKSVTLYGAKDYKFDAVKRTKGVRANATWINDAEVEQDKFVGLRGMLREGSLNAPITERIHKILHREYNKGKVGSGGRVRPWVYSHNWARGNHIT